MLTSNQRSKLRAQASAIEPIFQIGKGGVSEAMIQDLSRALDARELIKITVLKNSDLDPKETVNQLAELLFAEPVGAVGSKIVLYRYSKKKKEHVPLD